MTSLWWQIRYSNQKYWIFAIFSWCNVLVMVYRSSVFNVVGQNTLIEYFRLKVLHQLLPLPMWSSWFSDGCLLVLLEEKMKVPSDFISCVSEASSSLEEMPHWQVECLFFCTTKENRNVKTKTLKTYTFSYLLVYVLWHKRKSFLNSCSSVSLILQKQYNSKWIWNNSIVPYLNTRPGNLFKHILLKYNVWTFY